MAKKLLVRTPATRDGRTLVYDENRQPVFRETILELSARRGLESENATRAEHMRHEFTEIDVPDQRRADGLRYAAPAEPAPNKPAHVAQAPAYVEPDDADDLAGPPTTSAPKPATKKSGR